MEDKLAALLVECHRLIEESASLTASALVNHSAMQHICYPPNAGLNKAERSALGSIENTPELESALRKVIANAAAAPLFSLFSCIDGVADPSEYDKEWLGLKFSEPTDGDSQQMLHDDFFETYWRWREIRNNPGWKLDALQE